MYLCPSALSFLNCFLRCIHACRRDMCAHIIWVNVCMRVCVCAHICLSEVVLSAQCCQVCSSPIVSSDIVCLLFTWCSFLVDLRYWSCLFATCSFRSFLCVCLCSRKFCNHLLCLSLGKYAHLSGLHSQCFCLAWLASWFYSLRLAAALSVFSTVSEVFSLHMAILLTACLLAFPSVAPCHLFWAFNCVWVSTMKRGSTFLPFSFFLSLSLYLSATYLVTHLCRLFSPSPLSFVICEPLSVIFLSPSPVGFIVLASCFSMSPWFAPLFFSLILFACC